MLGIVKKMFGDANERDIKRMMRTVEQINALESKVEALTDEALRAKTDEFRERYPG
jgi:preprotein translocase subunit SecA